MDEDDLAFELDMAAAVLAARARKSNSGIFAQDGPLGQVNQAIAEGAGGLVDFFNPLDDLGITGSAQTGIERGMDAIGAARARNAPETLPQQFGRGVGQAATALIPVAGVAGKARQAGGILGGVADDIFRSLSTKSAVVGETIAGGGAAAGGEVAAQRLGEKGRIAGEIIGGIGAPAAALGAGKVAGAAGRAALKAPGVGLATRTLNRSLLPFSGSGARQAASDRVRSLTGDIDSAVDNLGRESVGDLTPAQQSGDPGLAALEARVAKDDPRFGAELRRRTAESQGFLRDDLLAIAGGGDVNRAVDFISGRRETFRKRLDGMVESARKRADDRIAALSPARRQSANSGIVREEIDKAFKAARKQEANLWARIPSDTPFSSVGARDRFTSLVDETPIALRDDIPDEARRALASNAGIPEDTTIGEMLGLVSKMRAVARASRSGETPNFNRARIADEIADGVLGDIENIQTTSRSVARAVVEARAFSRELSERFKRGAVNSVRTRSGTGGGRVAPESTLDVTVGRAGARGAVATDEIRAAVDAPDGRAVVDDATEDFLRGEATDATVRGGRFSDSSAERFQTRNRDTLDRFPQLRDDLDAARAASQDATTTERRVADLTARLNDKRRSVDAAFIQATPGEEITTAVFAARNPALAARKVRNAAAKDSTGVALDGLKSGFLDELIGTSIGAGLDSQSRRVISGTKLTARLADKSQRAALAQIFSPAEMRNIDIIAEQLLKVERALATGAADSVIDDLPNAILSFAVTSVGARQGARVGAGISGASLKTSAEASNRFKRLLGSLTNDRAEQLIKDAVKDPELMRALLLNLDSPGDAKIAGDRLKAWLIGVGAVATRDDEQ